MTIADRRRREKERRRCAIVDAAERAFLERGPDAATMDEIAAAAELSKGLIYHYFQNKEALFAAVVDRGARMLAERFQEAIAAHQRGLDQVEAIGRAYMAFAEEQRDHFEAMIQWSSRTGACDGPVSQKQDEAIALVARAVATGIADGSIRSDLDPMSTAYVLWAQTHGLLQIAQIQRHPFDLQAVRELAFAFARDALSPARPTASL